MSDLTFVTPDIASRQSAFLNILRSCSIFGSPEWLSVLQDSYGFRPGYAVLKNTKNKISFVLPFMEVRSLLTGYRGISAPFSDYCDIFAENKNVLLEGIASFKEYGRKKGWNYMELRPEHAEVERDIGPASTRYYTHSLDLRPSTENLFASFSAHTKRNIRKAQNSDLSVTVSTALGDLLRFYDLHTLTRKHHGLPPQPLSFFRQLHNKIISHGNGMVLIVSNKRGPVAGNVYLLRGGRAWYKYGAMDRRHAVSRAPFLAMWEAIRALRTSGAQTLCLGRTDIRAKGLIRFKEGWGAKRRSTCYIRYDYDKKCFRENHQETHAGATIFRALPPRLLQLAGKFLYRHVA